MYADNTNSKTWADGAATDYGKWYTSVTSVCIPKVGKVYTAPYAGSVWNECSKSVPGSDYR